MDGKDRFSGRGFEQGDFTPQERAQLRELLREMIASYLHIEPAVIDRVRAAATVIDAVIIVGKVIAVVGPIAAFVGAYFALKGA